MKNSTDTKNYVSYGLMICPARPLLISSLVVRFQREYSYTYHLLLLDCVCVCLVLGQGIIFYARVFSHAPSWLAVHVTMQGPWWLTFLQLGIYMSWLLTNCFWHETHLILSCVCALFLAMKYAWSGRAEPIRYRTWTLWSISYVWCKRACSYKVQEAVSLIDFDRFSLPALAGLIVWSFHCR